MHPNHTFAFVRSQDLLDSCTWDQQAELLQRTVNAAVTLQHGNLTRAYRTAFLRCVIAELETRNTPDGIHDDLYATMAATVSVPAGVDGPYAWRHFELHRAGSPHCISLRQRQHCISGGTTGLHTWQAAGALAEWAVSGDGRGELCGRRVLELGSGTGLTGLVVAKVCRPRSVVLTDGNEQVLELLRANVALNCVDGGDATTTADVLVRALDWDTVDGASDELLAQCGGGPPDVILAADVVYDDTLFVPLCRALDALFRIHATATAAMTTTTTTTSGCCAFLAATVRNADTLQQFLTQLGECECCALRHTHPELPRPARERESSFDLPFVTQNIMHTRFVRFAFSLTIRPIPMRRQFTFPVRRARCSGAACSILGRCDANQNFQNYPATISARISAYMRCGHRIRCAEHVNGLRARPWH